MPPDAFTFDTSGELIMQTMIGGPGSLFGPLAGAAVWLYLRDFLQSGLGLGAAWKLVLGIIFVLLVCFLRRGVIGGVIDLIGLIRPRADLRRASRGPVAARCPGQIAPRAAARPGAGSAWPDPPLWRPARQRRHQLHSRTGRVARRHRPERRRQKHVLQDDHL